MSGKAIRETLAALGVVASLVFVGLEITQNTDIVKAQTRGEITQSILSLIEAERHPDIMEAHLRTRRGEALSDEQKYLLLNMANATLRVWENTYYQYSAGLFDEDEYQADLVVWGEVTAHPIYIEHWLGNRMTYSAQFRAVIDGLVSTTP